MSERNSNDAGFETTGGRRHGGWQDSPSGADCRSVEDSATATATPTPWSVRVQGSASHGSSAGEYQATAITGDGVVLDGGADVDWGPFVWLDVALPCAEPVHVLGAVEGRHDPVSLALNVKFKHLFPDHRRRWQHAVSAAQPAAPSPDR